METPPINPDTTWMMTRSVLAEIPATRLGLIDRQSAMTNLNNGFGRNDYHLNIMNATTISNLPTSMMASHPLVL